MNNLKLLIFKAGEVIIGVDTEQINGMLTLEQAEEMEMEVTPFHRMVPFKGQSVDYRSPKVLLLKADPPFAVVIESPEDIISAEIDSIHPLPPALAVCNPIKAIWGIAGKEEGIILLVDFLRLQGAPEASKTEKKKRGRDMNQAFSKNTREAFI